ncbi:MAG: SNF2-related protein [Desulfurococcaceae archaeon]
MSLSERRKYVNALLKIFLKSLLVYNPYFSLFYNPLSEPSEPQVTSKPYYNYIHQVSLLLDVIPRSRVRLLIGDEVGLGKTVEAIRIIKYLISTGQIRKVLIIAPKMLIKQWLYHDIKDLLYSPKHIRRITRKNIDQIRSAVDIEFTTPIIYLASTDLVKRGSIDKHSKGVYKPYYDFISSIEWDLVVIDEAHQLGFTKPRSSLRTKRISPICMNAKHLILLSATPSRGTHEDMLGRISLIYPEFRDKIRNISRDESLRSDLYRFLSDYAVFRRTKEYVNNLEDKQVFTKLHSFMALIELGDKYRLYEDLNRVVSKILKFLDKKATGLLKAIVLKRAVSSPLAFLKTINKVLSEENKREVREIPVFLNDSIVERNVDELIENIFRSMAREIPREEREEVCRLIGEFEDIYKEGDPGFKALAHLLYNVVNNPKQIPKELVGDYVVFSEYRDTVEYVYNKLIEFFTNHNFKLDEKIKRSIIEKTVETYRDKRYVLERLKKYVDLLNNSIDILINEVNKKAIFIVKLSSQNQDIVHLIPDLIDSLNELLKTNVLKILISTDIASEGLNLYHFNIVVNYDIPWSPVRREQRIGRVHRLRQKRECTVLDFVRKTYVDLEFYRKLVLKLLNMVEQRISSKPLEGVFELYVVKKSEFQEEYLQIMESDIASALCKVYEDYYIHGRDISELLESVVRELSDKLRKYRDLVENLTSSHTDISTKQYVYELTGCRNHEHFTDTLYKVYSSLVGGPRTEVSKMLRQIYERVVHEDEKQCLDPNLVLLVKDSSVEKGYLGLVNFVVDGNVKYSTPILFLYKNNQWEIKKGVELIEWIFDGLSKGIIEFIKIDLSNVKNDEREFEKLVNSYTSRINLLFYQRFGRRGLEIKNHYLSDLIEKTLRDFKKIEPVIQNLFIRVIGVQSINEYSDYIRSLPDDLKNRMEKESIEYIKELFENRSCNVLEVNIGIYKPYDLMVECIEGNEKVKYMIEVKSHLKRVFVAELTPSETELAEKNPDNYIVCNVAGLENPNKYEWIVYCDKYSRIEKEIVVKTREEKIAKLFFSLQ